MAAPMIPVPNNPGICKRGSRYVIKWRDRGKQHKQSFHTLEEARLAKAKRNTGDTQASTTLRFDEYAEQWLKTYRERTQKGLANPHVLATGAALRSTPSPTLRA